MFAMLQEFTCRMYAARSSICSVNELRYQLFRAKQGDLHSWQLPPCEDCLHLHALRANYQAGIWQRTLERFPSIPEPHEGHGWSVDDDGKLVIHWMNGTPALDAVLELISCKCPWNCVLPSCLCLANGLKCTRLADFKPAQTCKSITSPSRKQMMRRRMRTLMMMIKLAKLILYHQ